MSGASSLDIAALGRPRRDVSSLMRAVMLALVPGTLVQAWLVGGGVLTNLSVVVLAALALEALVLRIRRRPLRPALGDGSIVLAAWLLALTLPPGLPVGQLLAGTAAMVLLGKHLYGGLGHNPFNPAMVGYAVLIVSFPVSMTAWPETALVRVSPLAPPVDERVDTREAGENDWDAITAATPLDRLRTLEREAAYGSLAPSREASVNTGAIRPGDLILDSPWPWTSGAFLVGGLWLLARGLIGWRIPCSVLGTLALLHAAHGSLAAMPQPPVHAELLAGAAVLGAFFVATDPVSAPSAPRARLLYGTGIGTLTFALREFSAYPEGFAFAVLLMNATVPLLDRLSGAGNRARATDR